MILIDFNQIAIAAMAHETKDFKTTPELPYFRHCVLNSIRACRMKFKNDYEEIVICCDGKYPWRRVVFPQYKQNRRKARDKSLLDWGKIHEMINTIRIELIETFPYKVIHIDDCEGDDVIGTLIAKYGKHEPIGTKEILIYSTDKDFKQLLHYSNVQQYSPTKKEFVACSNPAEFLYEHILKGDSADGIPNVRSYDSQLVDGVRQKPITAKFIEKYRDEELQEEPPFQRNKRLIDLTQIPEHIQEMILNEYDKPMENSRKGLMTYMMKHKLDFLFERLNEF